MCVVEAKKDDFEQGLAQCLVEMQACQWKNQQTGREISIAGIVTNGETWKCYKLDVTGIVYEILPYSLSNIDQVLGLLCHIFIHCDSLRTSLVKPTPRIVN